MKIIIWALGLCSFLSLQSQSKQFFFGQNGDDVIQEIMETPDGNLLALGTFTETQRMIWLQKIDLTGQVLWERAFRPDESNLDEFGYGLKILDSGEILIVGRQIENQRILDGKGLLLKTDADGNLLWKKVFEDAVGYYDVEQVNDQYFLVGQTEKGAGFDSGYFTITEEDGTEISSQIFSHYASNILKKILPISNGEFMLFGISESTGAGINAILMVRIRTNGSKIWQRTIPTDSQDGEFLNERGRAAFHHPYTAVNDRDGSIWILDSNYGYEILLTKITTNGTVSEQIKIDHPNYLESGTCLKILSSGEMIIAGGMRKLSGGDFQGFLLKLDQDKNTIFRRIYTPEDGDDGITSCLTNSTGQLWMAGLATVDGNSEGWLLRPDKNGNVLPFTVKGEVILDMNGNCIKDAGDLPAVGQAIISDNPTFGNFTTDSLGQFSYFSDEGSVLFQLEIADPDNWESCGAGYLEFDSRTPSETSVTLFLKPITASCSVAEVSLTEPFLQRCSSSVFFAQVQNSGFETTDSLTLEMELEEDLFLEKCSTPFRQSGTKIEINIPPLSFGESKIIEFIVNLDCDVRLGKAHPIVAKLTPPQCQTSTDEPNLKISGRCEGSEVIFKIKNEGGGGPDFNSRYRVWADNLVYSDSLTLQLPEGGAEQTLTFPATGDTWRVELLPAIPKPFLSNPIANVEGCGEAKDGFLPFDKMGDFPFVQESKEISAVVPLNMTATPPRIVSIPRGHDYSQIFTKIEPIEYSLSIPNPTVGWVRDAELRINPSDNFLKSSFRPLAANVPVTHTILPDGTISVFFKDIDIDTPVAPDSEMHFRFRITPDPAKATFNSPLMGSGTSQLKINAKAFFDGDGPYTLQEERNILAVPIVIDKKAEDIGKYSGKVFRMKGKGQDRITNSALFPDGSVLLCGQTESYSDLTRFDGLLIKTDSDGMPLWTKTLGFDDLGNTDIRGLHSLGNGDFFIAGRHSNLQWSGDTNIFYGVIDALGNWKWHKFVSKNVGTTLLNLIPTKSGDFILTGANSYTPHASSNSFIRKITTTGETLWQKTRSNSLIFPSWILEEETGDFAIVGQDPQKNWRIAKLDSEGNQETQRTLSSEGKIYWIWDFEKNTDGNYRIFGRFEDWIIGGVPIKNLVFTETAEILKEEVFDVELPVDLSFANRGIKSPDGGYFFLGQIARDSFSSVIDNDAFLMKSDSSGAMEWWKTYELSGAEEMHILQLTKPRNFVLAGNLTYSSGNYGTYDALIIRDTFQVGTSSTKDISELSSKRTIDVFPNPSDNDFEVHLSEKLHDFPAEWQVSDAAGRVYNQGKASSNKFTISGEGLPPGIYFLSFKNEVFSGKKLVKVW